MKKTISLFIILVLLFSFMGCNSDSHVGEVKIPYGRSEVKGKNYKEVLNAFTEKGFKNIKMEKLEDLITGWITKDGSVEDVIVGGLSDYSSGKWVPEDTEVIIQYHTFYSDTDEEKGKETEDKTTKESNVTDEYTKSTTEQSKTTAEEKTVNYSSNDRDTAKKGNTGKFAYKNNGEYSVYYIIDFDEKFVYRFSDGEESGDKARMVSGDLNDILLVEYRDGNDEWVENLHFKWKNQPDHLVVQDFDGFEYDFYDTDLNEAIKIRDTKKIVNRY